ncbi:MAG: AraC family transcriptional regulator [Clostridiales bacterium]|nr:AraC family transcriptional regulator [Clostridiales bacterium]
MSKEGCCRFFKRMTGQTLSQYLESYRISQSLSLLSDGKLPILQVAAQVGFSNAGRFSAAFQKKNGLHAPPVLPAAGMI